MKRINRLANKGEWPEFYAFLKIIEQKKLPAANKNLEIINNKSFVFYKVIREEDGLTKIYDLSDSSTDIIITDQTGAILKKIPNSDLKSKTLKIFDKIKSGKKTFQIQEAEDLMTEMLCEKVKADNSKKSDITAIIYDRISETMPKLGFSVKSMIGGASTLLNAGKTTNFIFKVRNFKGDIKKINAIKTRSKIRDRLSEIISHGGSLTFSAVSNKKFESNLKSIDTAFPKFISQMLLDFFLGKASLVQDLVKILSQNHELKKEFELSLSSYELKIKLFLDAIALGMVPKIEWEGLSESDGGYIIVKRDGEVICYHSYNRDEFKSYLYENTKFESASSTRHNYGFLYEKDGELFFNLNLQIRFIK